MIQYVWRRLSTASSQVLENNKVKEFEGTNQGLESKQMSKRGHFCITWSWQLKPGSGELGTTHSKSILVSNVFSFTSICVICRITYIERVIVSHEPRPPTLSERFSAYC